MAIAGELLYNFLIFLSSHAIELRMARGGVLDRVQVAIDKWLGDARLCVEWRNNEKLQTKLSEQFQRVTGVLIIDLREHFVDNHEVKTPRRVAVRVHIELIGKCSNQNRKRELRLLTARLAGASVIAAS